jgi:hypothetical protein
MFFSNILKADATATSLNPYLNSSTFPFPQDPSMLDDRQNPKLKKSKSKNSNSGNDYPTFSYPLNPLQDQTQGVGIDPLNKEKVKDGEKGEEGEKKKTDKEKEKDEEIIKREKVEIEMKRWEKEQRKIEKINKQLSSINKNLNIDNLKKKEEPNIKITQMVKIYICIVCRRKFKSMETLEKHQKLSELHQNNLRLLTQKKEEIVPEEEEDENIYKIQDQNMETQQNQSEEKP